MTPREHGAKILDVNVTSAQLLTDKMIPLLEKSRLPKVIFVSSGAGSIQRMLDRPKLMEGPKMPASPVWYCASKTAMNYLAAYYSKRFPTWKSNTVCPGFRATKINGAELNDDTDPALGAVRVMELVKEGPDGVTGTYSNKDEKLPW